MASTGVLLVALVLVLLAPSLVEARVQLESDKFTTSGTEKTLPQLIDCGAACGARCRLSSRPHLCKRACGTCCAKCNCVPPGTYGNQEKCPCYASLTTRGNKRKCP